MTDHTHRTLAALTACSNPVSAERQPEIRLLEDKLTGEGIEVKMTEGLFVPEGLSPEQRGKELTDCFRDPQVDYIFDVSGGDLSNMVLPYLDFDVVRSSRAVFCGYSDLTTVINAIIAKTGRWAVNYQICHILYDHGREQTAYLLEKLLPGKIAAEDLEYRFLRGNRMQGRILGGNIRCFLKLAGTEYLPDLTGSILLLESMGGGVFQMMTYLEQYRQIGAFEKINGILLGTFSRMEEEQQKPSMEELVLRMVPEHIPVAATRYVGHYSDARAVVLGREMQLSSTSERI